MLQENKKWYPIEHDGFWGIYDNPVWENGKDILVGEEVGESQAEENARLCAASPVMRELLRDMYDWLETYKHTSAGIQLVGKNHPVQGLIKRYKEFQKEIE